MKHVWLGLRRILPISTGINPVVSVFSADRVHGGLK